MSTVATPIRMGRIRADAERPKACESTSKINCPKYEHPASYRIEKTDPATGVIWRRCFCTSSAAAWAARHHIAFPPGLW